MVPLKTLVSLALLIDTAEPLTAVSERGFAKVMLVKDTKPTAIIVLPQLPQLEETHAATELQAYIEKMTGAKLLIAREDAEVSAPYEVHTGQTKFVKGLKLNWEAIDIDGFIIRTVGNRLILCGREPHGTEFAVYRFLYKYGGVRWYIPTELGEHVPKRKDFVLPPIDDVEQPDFLSRQWSAVAPFDGGVWEKRNLMRARFNFHHNLLRVFPPDLFEKHPEWFPLRGGQRYKPRGPDDHGWQPCMSNPDAAKHAAQVAARFFDQNPKAISFSLGINDSNAYCECDGCKALVAHGRKFRDRPDYSDLVFTFLNRAAEELVKTHPDKYIGCLAYSWCENVPSFPVHPHIIPYLTNDRSQWRDPEFKRLDQDLIRRWTKAVPIVAIYDYYYGSGYVIPRIFTRLIDESLKFCKEAGVKGFYAEIYSNWSLDGLKAWLASQLLWDTDQDMETLLDDFYTNFFGKAAEPMRRYFELCERHWINQPGKGHWLRYFFDPTQLELFPPEVCAEARRYLTQAIAVADNELVKRRVQLYSEGFRYTELYSKLYHTDKQLLGLTIQTRQQFEKAAKLVHKFVQTKQELDRYYREVILTNPLHKPVIPFTERARWEPGAGLTRVMLQMADWGKRKEQSQRVEQMMSDLEQSFPNSEVALAAKAIWTLQRNPKAGVQRLLNPGLENIAVQGPPPQGPDWDSSKVPLGWSSWIRPGTKATLIWTDKEARTGKASVMMTDVEGAATFHQPVAVKPGELYLASVFVKAKVTGSTKVQLRIQWQDEQGHWLSGIPPKVDLLPTGETKEWQQLAVFFRVPEGVGRAVLLLTVYDQSPSDFAIFDDASLLRIEVQ